MEARRRIAAFGAVLLGVQLALVPHWAARRVDEAWAPFLGTLRRAAPMTGEWVDLDAPGEYVVLLEGPADDPLWDEGRVDPSWVRLLDGDGLEPLAWHADVELDYVVNGRRGRALSRVTAGEPDTYVLRFTGPGVASRGFQVGLHTRERAVEHTRAAASWRTRQWITMAALAVGALALAAVAAAPTRRRTGRRGGTTALPRGGTSLTR